MTAVLHVTEDHSFANTGITFAVDALMRHLSGMIEQSIFCVGQDAIPAPDGVDLHCLALHGPGKVWRMPFGGQAELKSLIAKTEIVHLHGIWMWPQWAAARIATAYGHPVILTLHGMLEPWKWKNQKWLKRLKKRFYWHGLAYPAFRSVQIIHALTLLEASQVMPFFPDQRIKVIPSGLDLASIGQAFSEPVHKKPELPYFLFVGRLHPSKGVDQLIRAFARLPQNRFRLRIAGPTQQREQVYADSLPRLAKALGVSDRVEFLGPVQGVGKWRLYQNAWAFCLPTLSEGLSTVVLEAAACATPVITTRASGVVETWEQNGGVLIRQNTDEIASALEKALHWTPSERQQRGEGLRKLVATTYNWESIAPAWQALYQELAK
jgi:glycosyltransferase involved in cell wall biosynthesis